MEIDVYEIIEDFNELLEYKLIHQKDRMLTIYDLQVKEEFTIKVIDWLEKIYDYYTIELTDMNDVHLDFDDEDFDFEFLIYYYKTLLEIVYAVQKEKTLYG